MNEVETIENALIKYVSISMADHGVLTFYIGLKFASSFCCFGGYIIGHGYLGAEQFDATDKGLTAMMKIMDVVGVDKWEDLQGKYCRVKSKGLGDSIKTIGNIMSDKWFNIEEHFKEDIRYEEST